MERKRFRQIDRKIIVTQKKFVNLTENCVTAKRFLSFWRIYVKPLPHYDRFYFLFSNSIAILLRNRRLGGYIFANPWEFREISSFVTSLSLINMTS